jgi:hypothetical protein
VRAREPTGEGVDLLPLFGQAVVREERMVCDNVEVVVMNGDM